MSHGNEIYVNRQPCRFVFEKNEKKRENGDKMATPTARSVT